MLFVNKAQEFFFSIASSVPHPPSPPPSAPPPSRPPPPPLPSPLPPPCPPPHSVQAVLHERLLCLFFMFRWCCESSLQPLCASSVAVATTPPGGFVPSPLSASLFPSKHSGLLLELLLCLVKSMRVSGSHGAASSWSQPEGPVVSSHVEVSHSVCVCGLVCVFCSRLLVQVLGVSGPLHSVTLFCLAQTATRTVPPSLLIFFSLFSTSVQKTKRQTSTNKQEDRI